MSTRSDRSKLIRFAMISITVKLDCCWRTVLSNAVLSYFDSFFDMENSWGGHGRTRFGFS